MQEPKEIIFNGERYWGFKSPCPRWLREKYLQAANYTCDECPSKEKLEVHRIKRGCEGGLYVVVPKNHILNNIKVLCEKCHEKYNYSRKTPNY